MRLKPQNVDLLYVSQLDASGNATSDSDVLVNAEHLYGSTGVLGQTITDVNGDGYDVLTSAIGTGWNNASTDIFYDGNHNAFTDTHDGLDRNATSYSVGKSGVNSEQLDWANEIQSDTGGSATPSFYIVVSGKKVPVYLDNTDRPHLSGRSTRPNSRSLPMPLEQTRLWVARPTNSCKKLLTILLPIMV